MKKLSKARFNVSGVTLLLLAVFALAWLLVALYGRGSFVSVDNLSNIVVRSVALGVVAVGQTFTILVGSLDLSVSYLISLTAVMASYIMQGDPARIPLAVALVIPLGLFVGLVNGLLITKLKVNPLIATLGVGLIIRGVLNSSFENFAGSVPRSFQGLAYGRLGPVPLPIILLALVTAAAYVLLRATRFGAHLYAVGGNEQAARLSGIRTDRVIIGAHMIVSLGAVISGLFIVSRLRAGAPWVGPDGAYDLESIAAVVVGGTALSGGRGGVLGTLAGVLIFGILDTAFNQLGIGAFAKQLLRGLIIIAAVASYSACSKKLVG